VTHFVISEEPSPRALLLQLLSVQSPDELLAVRTLVDAGAIFDHSPSAMRVALSRLRADALVEAPERGWYRIAESGRELATHVGGWRRVRERVRPWEGGWIGVAAATGRDRQASRLRRRALELHGFEPLRRGLQIRPANLALSLGDLRERLVALGLDEDTPVFRIDDLGPSREEALALWDGRAIDAEIAGLRRSLRRATKAIRRQSPRRAARTTFLAGGAVLRHLAFDPLLPAPIVDVEARHALADEMRAFDELGRACWREALHLEAEAA